MRLRTLVRGTILEIVTDLRGGDELWDGYRRGAIDVRLTAHNGRAGKHGTYSAKHNDRNFDVRKADHIDEGRSAGNSYWCCYEDMTFEDAEALYYEQHFRQVLDERNERSIEARHPERVKSMDDYRTSKKTCPEETILQVGHKGEAIDPRTLWNICAEYVNWEQQRFPNVKVLDVALHVDEQGAPHMHERKVWIAHDEQGREMVGQTQALREMGIAPPKPDKPYGKYNNAKMTYTQECREKLFEIAHEHGLDLEREPKEHSETGLALEEYKARQEQEKARQTQKELEEVRQWADIQKRQMLQMEEEYQWVRSLCEEQEMQLQWQEQEIDRRGAEIARMEAVEADLQESMARTQDALETAQNGLREVASKQGELDAVNAQLETARQELKQTLDMKARASEIRRPWFHRGPTVSYHENMLEATRAIGSEAYEHMQEAESKLSQVAKREAVVERKEREIGPLHERAKAEYDKAKAEYDKAHEYKERQESYILGTADKKAQEKVDGFIEQQFGRETSGRYGRMERFLAAHTQDGRSLLDKFNVQEQALKRRLSRAWAEER